MKAKAVVVGNTYLVKVTGRIVPVQIIAPDPRGGWNAVNTVTGRSLRLKSAARLRAVVNA